MNERETILTAITANKPAFIPAPDLIFGHRPTVIEDLQSRFAATLQSIGGTAYIVDNYEAVATSIRDAKSTGEWIVNTIPEVGVIDPAINSEQTATDLERVHIAYIRGSVAVAENGAIWVKESQAVNRLLPFICQHLVLVVDATLIVPTMHEAYSQIAIGEEGYGVFIAGPSKTADIEQALVIGAHGPRSLVVYLVQPANPV